jgi:Bacterial Ig-like domain (group 1)
MRPYPLFVVALCAAIACSRDLTSNNSPSTSGTSTSSGGLNITVDSDFTNRTAVVGTAIPAIVHVTRSGQSESGVTVSWVSPDGGLVSPTTSMTDASGAATATWTLGDTARAYTLTAAITGASVTMQATATAGPLDGLLKITQDSLVVAAGASTLITARAVDKTGNPVAGVAVSWTTTGGALTVTTTTTGASGNAEVAFSSEATPRNYTVSATAAGVPSVTFIVLAQ